MANEREKIATYYDIGQKWYSRGWSDNALHYGFWYPETKSLEEALQNQNDEVMELLQLKDGLKILDCGCGVGGTALKIARRYAVHATGLTLSKVQHAIAVQKAADEGLTDRLTFAVGDYHHTGFPDASFDRVYGIESICYADPKLRFLQEAFRVLRPGGRLVVSDGFLHRRPTTPRDVNAYRKWCEGWHVPGLATMDEFRGLLEACGFRQVQCIDKSSQVTKSAKLILLAGCVTPVAYCLYKLKLVPDYYFLHNRSNFYQHRVFTTFGGYANFAADKPSS